MGGAGEPPEIKLRRAVYERTSCKESVFGSPSKHRSAHTICNISKHCSYEMYHYVVQRKLYNNSNFSPTFYC